jgi:hypothetical protein
MAREGKPLAQKVMLMATRQGLIQRSAGNKIRIKIDRGDGLCRE